MKDFFFLVLACLSDIQHLFFSCCCCLRKKQKNQIIHLNLNDPSSSFIYLGIDALKISKSKRILLADFGSSHGQNSMETMKLIVKYLEKIHKFREIPLIIHVDLPTNNWTKFFQNLSANNSYYGLATGRSFYEQCFPDNSLSIGYSSASLHYLSRKPCNITNHCYIHYANENERQKFQEQSKIDFDLFIEYRSKELHSGGILILNIPSINHENDEISFNQYFHWIYQCAEIVLSREELIDFTYPFYLRSLPECYDTDLFLRYSLKLLKIELIHLKSFLFLQYENQQITFSQFSQSIYILMQSSTEPILRQILAEHQRSNEEIIHLLKQFWSLFKNKIQNEMHPKNLHTYVTCLILQKL